MRITQVEAKFILLGLITPLNLKILNDIGVFIQIKFDGFQVVEFL